MGCILGFYRKNEKKMEATINVGDSIDYIV